MDLEKRLRVECPCMFCENHTHDFPSDEWHEKKHMSGWHTCGIDHVFRRVQPFCKDFKLDGVVMGGC